MMLVRNCTPSSTALVSLTAGTDGTTELLHRLHGHVAGVGVGVFVAVAVLTGVLVATGVFVAVGDGPGVAVLVAMGVAVDVADPLPSTTT